MPGNDCHHPFPLFHFSIFGTVRMWGYMGTLLLRGAQSKLCFSSFINSPTVQFWSFLFVLNRNSLNLVSGRKLCLSGVQSVASLLKPSPLPITWRVPSPPLGPKKHLSPKPLFRFSAAKTRLPVLKIPPVPLHQVRRVVPTLGDMSAMTPSSPRRHSLHHPA